MEQNYPQAPAGERGSTGRRCPSCGRTYADPVEVETINDWGYCLACDKAPLRAA